MSTETKRKLSVARAGTKAPWMLGNAYGKAQIGQKRPGVGGRKKGSLPWNRGLKGFNAGENNGMWIPDRSLIKLDTERGGPLHKQWSRAVKLRDGWRCKVANEECDGRMESHHILSWKESPELRYEISNGITLCHAHHPRKDEEASQLAPLFKELILPTYH